MKTRPLFFLLALLSFGFGRPLLAADGSAPAKSGYTVLLEMQVDEKGAVEDAKILSSEDTSPDHVLDMLAFERARAMKLPVHEKDGHPVKYLAKAPIVFLVDGDQGPEANKVPTPGVHSAIQPVYPADLLAKGEVGGAIVEFSVDVKGNVTNLRVLDSSNPEFGEAAAAALKQWVFTPAKMNGTPFESRWHIAISFMTDVRVPEWKWRFAPRPSLGNFSVLHRTLPLPPAAPEQKPAAPATAPADKK